MMPFAMSVISSAKKAKLLPAVVGAEAKYLVVAAFSVWTQIAVPTGKRSEHPRGGMPLVARLLVSSEQAWKPMASSR
jgi:hypothetical protein